MNPFVYLVMILGLLIVLLLTVYAFKHLGRGWSLKILFKDFNRKMWMTISLGIVFLGLYLSFVLILTYFIRTWKIDLFSMVYHNPIPFIYGGLWLFACLSLSVYLARMIIKYFYLTRGKDS